MKSNRTLELIYGKATYDKVTQSNLLVVGAGGIGCELVKNLGKSGYKKFTLIDLDTIEVSNLNRQFYFRPQHAKNKRSKAEVARECILEINPGLEIEAFKASIFEERFNLSFYLKFDVVFCALDNKEAREHLGKMCTMSNRVLVDAGTQGYSGQVKTQIRGLFECNHCKPIPPPQTFAICTIRNDPSQPIHCIVWGKYLYEVLLGPQDEENVLSKHIELNNYLNNFNDESLTQAAVKLFEKVFYDDIVALKKVDDSKSHIKPLKYEEALRLNEPLVNINLPTPSTSTQRKVQIDTQKLWTLAECAKHFVTSFVESLKIHRKDIGMVKFDKDDDHAMNIVCAAANLRTFNYLPSIPGMNKLEYQSLYDVKEKAGNIIPAIASTNAIVAAVQITESVKVLEKRYDDLRAVWLANQPPYKLTNTYNSLPRLACTNCSDKYVYMNLEVDFEKFTLGDFKTLVSKVYRANAINIWYHHLQIYDEKATDEDDKEMYQESLKKNFTEIQQSLLESFNVTFDSLSVRSPVEAFEWGFTVINVPVKEGIMNKDSIMDPEECFQQQKLYLTKVYNKEVENRTRYYNRFILP
jgi:ubiquitin-like 1-activating enzyme E1 B